MSPELFDLFMKDGLVFATHFIQIQKASQITKERLMQCFLRGAVILCPDCYPGIDGIIPVYLKSKNRLTFIFLQSRTDKTSDAKMAHARRTMSPRNFSFAHLIDRNDPYLII